VVDIFLILQQVCVLPVRLFDVVAVVVVLVVNYLDVVIDSSLIGDYVENEMVVNYLRTASDRAMVVRYSIQKYLVELPYLKQKRNEMMIK
jgi:hypothetical protein